MIKIQRLLIIVLLLAAAGCSVNPVTGKQEVSLVSEQWELKTGKQQYLPARQSQGGDYVADPVVEAYVNEVGQRLAAVSDRKLPYEFNVINNSVPNAWALPGGKISINRGLLTELNSEAELAAVLGHEIVHAAARHGAQGMQRGMLIQGAVLGTAIATQGESYANIARIGASLGGQLINTRYGRDAERESDHYGMTYMSRAGYDPQGAVELQKTFVRMKEGKQQSWLKGLFSSHPPSQERVENNTRMADELPKGGELGKGRYQQKMARLMKTQPAYEAYEQAQKALKEGDRGKARTLVKKAIVGEPAEGHFYSLAGDIEFGAKRYKTARSYYDKAIGRNDEFFYYHLRRGLVNEKLDNNSAARRDLERSNQLLPTASAHNALGNIARLNGDTEQATRHYRAASQQQSEAGKAAYGSLVELDLPANPQKYLKLKNVTDSLGRWYVEVSNPTPRAVTDLVIEIRYPDRYGELRSSRRQLKETLQAGEKTRLNTRLLVNPKQIRLYSSQLAAAKLAR